MYCHMHNVGVVGPIRRLGFFQRHLGTANQVGVCRWHGASAKYKTSWGSQTETAVEQ